MGGKSRLRRPVGIRLEDCFSPETIPYLHHEFYASSSTSLTPAPTAAAATKMEAGKVLVGHLAPDFNGTAVVDGRLKGMILLQSQ